MTTLVSPDQDLERVLSPYLIMLFWGESLGHVNNHTVMEKKKKIHLLALLITGASSDHNQYT